MYFVEEIVKALSPVILDGRAITHSCRQLLSTIAIDNLSTYSDNLQVIQFDFSLTLYIEFGFCRNQNTTWWCGGHGW
jgi:hypothetical protein